MSSTEMVTIRTSSKKSDTGSTSPTGDRNLSPPPKQGHGSLWSIAKTGHKREVDMGDTLSAKKMRTEDLLGPETSKPDTDPTSTANSLELKV